MALDFDLQQLRYFVAVAETQNVGRAAELLHISQSPLSRQIRQLEDRIGAPLFTRHKTRLQLNAAGRELLVEAKALLAHAERVQRHARDIAQGIEGTLVLGHVAAALHAGVLQRAIAAFRAQSPGVRLHVRSLSSAEQFAALDEREIDVGYTHLRPPPGAPLDAVQVVDEAFVMVLPSWRGREELLQACASAGWTPEVHAQAADPTAALGLAQAGVGAVFVQASLASALPGGLRAHPVPDAFGLRLQVHAVTGRPPTPLVKRWIEAQREVIDPR
jgi:DNA-binding transcriptional LysR family regulator